MNVPRNDAALPEQRSLVVVVALIAGFIALALGRLALQPGVGFWDTAEFQVVGPSLGTAHPTGFPAYVILSWLASIVFAPFGEPAFRVNLLSAALVGGAAAVTVVLVRQLTGHVWVGLGSGLVLAAVPIVWSISTHADAHALHLLLVTVLLVLLVGWERRVRTAVVGVAPRPPAGRRLAGPGDRWLLAAAIVYGVGLANHSLMLLLAPGIGLFVLVTAPWILRRPRFVAGLAGALLLTTLLLYLELPLRAGLLRAPLVYGHPERVDGFLYVVLAQQFIGSLYNPFAELGEKVVALFQLGLDQLGPLGYLVPLAFFVTALRQPRYALLTGVSFLVTVWFAASYVNADIGRYYLGPVLMVITWLAVLVVAFIELLARAFGAESLDAPRGVMMSPQRVAWFGTAGPAAFVLELAVIAALLTPTVRALPERGQTQDLSSDRTAQEWADTAMGILEPNAVVVSWWSYSTTLWYAQIIQGQRPDVWIVDDRTRLDENLGEVNDVIDAQLERRPVYVIRLQGDDDIAAVESRYELQTFEMPTEQPLIRILGRKAP